MIDANQVYDTFTNIDFDHHPGLWFRFGGSLEDGTSWVQLEDRNLPQEFSTGRKWRLSPYMTTSELVQTAWLAYQTWLEHEARESFKYKGVAIFGPHLDVEELVEFATERDNYEYR